jgi:hypothetical protein
MHKAGRTQPHVAVDFEWRSSFYFVLEQAEWEKFRKSEERRKQAQNRCE